MDKYTVYTECETNYIVNDGKSGHNNNLRNY